MKKRLRKKKKKGEYAEWGVEVTATLATPSINPDGLDQLLDEFVGFIEKNGWYCGGSISPEGEFSFVVELGRDRGQLVKDSQCLMGWLKSCSDLRDPIVSEPIDLWYPPKDMGL